MMQFSPLILTLEMDEASHTFFNVLRQAHFPKERNYLQAHLTLFHHLPGSQLSEILHTLKELCQTQEKLTLEVVGLKNIGRGVAFSLQSPDLIALHGQLQRRWLAWLTPQDKQKLWPHVTVQNKVRPAQAQELLHALYNTFTPFPVSGIGFQVWAYQGGPWELLHTLAFSGQA
ncbi:2'-5' RNA ligase family protein [Pontibacter sp. E15-1]|uniref:2'-5' RNA ligase family protein n=1 Tax=Pontibacter sp. E15-1 TaxID=2919918 RepID=UPI001F4F4E4B|nr:2'-5' RNA ligase family protein [Pontibacter sp. E15-1]MCJ8163554.1 2'-5' RNA ligase family protein [Pontibacter sp. E15-1]